MPLFRREKLHERLARQGGLSGQPAAEPHDPRPRWGEAGIHGIHRPREWDAVTTAQAPDLEVDQTTFVSLPDATLIIDDDILAEDLEPLVLAVETVLERPYRAEAVRQYEDVWGVAARRIDLVELPDVDGDELTLTMHEGSRTLTVDGRREFGSVPELERLVGERFESYAATATRLDGDLWEVRVSPL